jgi:ubiquinone/menaquinone biosynthesis C-methylase UbiE
MNAAAGTSDFHALEHAGWQAVPRAYEGSFASLTSQSLEPLLDAAQVRAGSCVLDVATGPGDAAAAAAARGADVVGVDFSAAMLGLARRRHPKLDLREADAQELPFRDASFDAVVMNFGLLHLPHPERGIAEAFRVLRPQGRFAFTVWAQPSRAMGHGIVLEALQRSGDLSVPLPPAPPFFRFSDTAECERVLAASGFAGVRVTLVPQTWRLASPEALFESMANSTVRMAALLKMQNARALAAIRIEVHRRATEYLVGDGVELPMPAVLASARKG